MDDRIRADNGAIHGYAVRDSSNVRYVGWQQPDHMLVIFTSGGAYRYDGVPRQRAVAAALAPSVGKYIRRHIIPNYEAVRL
jgi:KTSC domain